MSLTQPATLQKSGMPLPSTGRMSPQAGNTSNKQTHKRRDLREAVDEVYIFLQTTFITDFIIHLYYFFLEDSLHTMETGHTKCSRSRGWSILIAIILVCQTLIRWSIGDWVAWLICTSVAVDPLCTKKRSLWLICGHFYFDLDFSFSLFMLFLSLSFFLVLYRYHKLVEESKEGSIWLQISCKISFAESTRCVTYNSLEHWIWYTYIKG